MTIFIATDFSPCSQTATRIGAALARRLAADVQLFHAFDPTFDPLSLPAGAAWEKEMLAAAEGQLGRIADELRRTGLHVNAEVKMGSAASLISALARAAGANLIVVGTHGRRGAAHLYLGSVAERVTRTATCPVLITREELADADRLTSSTAPLNMTVVADGTPATLACVYWLRTAGQQLLGDPSLVRVYWPPEEAARYGVDEVWLGDEGHPDLLRLLERDLRHQAHALEGAKSPVVRFRVAHRDVGAALARDARELQSDALVVGIPQRRRGRAAPMDLASLLQAATVPVLCVPQSVRAEGRHIPAVHSILLACDLSDCARAAILPAYALLPGGGRVELCYVHEHGTKATDPAVFPVPALTENERATIEARLRDLVPAEAAEHGITTHVSVAESRAASEGILAAAQRLDVDVVALGSHGRSGFRRALLGSVAEVVSRQSARPVFIVHQPRS